MVGIVIERFGGERPRVDAKELPNNGAQKAVNVKLWNGVLDALKAPLPLVSTTKSGTMLSIYRQTDGTNDYWMHWPRDVDVVRAPVAGDDKRRLYYTGDYEPRVSSLEMTSSGTDTVNGVDNYPSGFVRPAGEYPLAVYALGVHNPNTAPTVGTPTGGTGTDETRVYVYTFVTAWGEESGPSPASTEQTGKPDGTWPLSGMDTAPLNTGSISGATHSAGVVTVTTTADHWLKKGHRIDIASVAGMTDLNGSWTVASAPSATTFTIALTTAQTYTSGGTWTRDAPYNTGNMQKRIYRSVTSGSGTDYQFVAEISAATTTYNDSLTPASLGETLPSLTWDMPPGDMIGLISLPNGYLMGFSGNEIYSSEPYSPYAWPTAYALTTDYSVVGMGAIGGTAVICTTAFPYQTSGFHPDSLTLSRVDGAAYPCMSKRGIVSMGFGVVYPSDQGLVIIGPAGNRLATDLQYDRQSWDDTVVASDFTAFTMDDRYYGFWKDSAGNNKGLIFAPSEADGALTENSEAVDAAWRDPETGWGYIHAGGKVCRWDSDYAHKETYEWKSKAYVMPRPVNFAWAKLIVDFTQSADEAAAISTANAATIASNTALISSIPVGVDKVSPLGGCPGGAAIGVYAVGESALGNLLNTEIQSVQFQLYGGGDLKITKSVSSTDPFRLPSGFRDEVYEVRLLGNVPVQGVQMAERMVELSQV